MSDSLAPEWMKVGGSSGRRSSTGAASGKPNSLRMTKEQLLAKLPKKPSKPACLRDFPVLEVPSYQHPLSLQPPSEEELQDLEENGINSTMFRQNFGRGRGRGRPATERAPLGPHRTPNPADRRGFQVTAQPRTRMNSNTDYNWRAPRAASDPVDKSERHAEGEEASEWDDPHEEGTFDEHGNFVMAKAESRSRTVSGSSAFDEQDGSGSGGWRQRLAARGDRVQEPPPGLAPPVVLEAVEWEYKDTTGVMQGPFTGSQMQEWFSANFLPAELKLRRTTDTQFVALKDLRASSLQHDTLPFLRPFPSSLLTPKAPSPVVADVAPPPNSMLARIQRASQAEQAPAPQAQPQPTAPPARTISAPVVTSTDLQRSQADMLQKLMNAQRQASGPTPAATPSTLEALQQQQAQLLAQRQQIHTYAGELQQRMQQLHQRHTATQQHLSNPNQPEMARHQLRQLMEQINADASSIRGHYTELQQKEASITARLQALAAQAASMAQTQVSPSIAQVPVPTQAQAPAPAPAPQANSAPAPQPTPVPAPVVKAAAAKPTAQSTSATPTKAKSKSKKKTSSVSAPATPSKPAEPKKPSGPSLAEIAQEEQLLADKRRHAEAEELAQQRVREQKQRQAQMQAASTWTAAANPVAPTSSSPKTMSLREIQEQEQKETAKRQAQQAVIDHQVRQAQMAQMAALTKHEQALPKQGSWVKGAAVPKAVPSKGKPKSLMEIAEEEARAQQASAKQAGRTAPMSVTNKPQPGWPGKPSKATSKAAKAGAGVAWGGAAPTPVAMPSTKAQPTRTVQAKPSSPEDDSFWMASANPTPTKGTKAAAKASSKSSTARASSSSRSAAAPTSTTLRLGRDAPLQPAFLRWCRQQLADVAANIDVDTFVGFLMDIGSASDVVEYVSEYFDNSAKARKFAHAFVERRVNAYGSGDVVVTKPAVVDDSWETGNKRKGKKKKQGFQKVDPRLLGYQVSSQQAPNRGEIDFGL